MVYKEGATWGVVGLFQLVKVLQSEIWFHQLGTEDLNKS
jgi:hypothetical protein